MGLTYNGQNLWARTLDTGAMQGWNMSFAAENTTVLTASNNTQLSSIDGQTAASGSRLAAFALPARDFGQENNYVLYSSEGNDITMAIGSSIDGAWRVENLPIPVD